MRKTCLAVAALLAAGGDLAAPARADPTFSPRVAALFDRALRATRQTVPGRTGEGVVRCFDYPNFRVKELDYDDHGDAAVSVTPEPGADLASRPRCGKQDDPGEIVLKTGAGSFFEGAKGEFVYVVSTWSSDTGPFWVHSGRTGQVLYVDEAFVGDEPKALSLDDGKLVMSYVRGAKSGCSILTGGQNCWAAISKQAHLAAAVASLAAPIAACEATYSDPAEVASGTTRNDPSVVTYEVTVEVEPSGRSVVTRRGPLGCRPAG